jgi:ABC-type multidrug transport system ATPase subunit
VTPAVAVSQLSKYFPRIELSRLLTGCNFSGSWALREVDLELWPGETLCIISPNGSGQTTLLKLIDTLLIPTQGRILVQGCDAVRRPLKVKRHLGFITSNEVRFYGRLTGMQNLAFSSRLQNLDHQAVIPSLVQRLQLEPYLERHFFSYSTGIKRWFDIARDLLHQPDVLMLDEPTSNLDPLISNCFSMVSLADYILVMEKGRILESGSYIELIQMSGKYARLFEMQVSSHRQKEISECINSSYS